MKKIKFIEKSSLSDHFKSECKAKSTIYRIINCYESGNCSQLKNGRVRKPKIMTKKNLGISKRLTNNKSGISQQQLASRFKFTQSFINKTLKTKIDIVCRKKQKIPDTSDQQKALPISKCSTLSRKYKNHVLIMDDQSYFT